MQTIALLSQNNGLLFRWQRGMGHVEGRVLTPPNYQNARIPLKIGIETIFGTRFTKMIISMTLDEGMGPHLETVAEESKRVMPTVDFDENRYVYHIRYGESGNIGPLIIVTRQRGGALMWG